MIIQFPLGGCLAIAKATLCFLWSSCCDNDVSVLPSAITRRALMASQLSFEHVAVVLNQQYCYIMKVADSNVLLGVAAV